PKLLKETEVYVKYGLHDKAQEHLRRILAADPNNLDAHEKAKTVALASGRTDDAIAELATLVRLYTQRRDPRAQQARSELRDLDPRNAALAGAPAPAPAAMAPRHEIELDPAEAEIELETAEAEQGLDEPLVEAEIEADSLPLPDEDEPLLEAEPLAAAPAARGEDAFASDLAEADFYIES